MTNRTTTHRPYAIGLVLPAALLFWALIAWGLA